MDHELFSEERSAEVVAASFASAPPRLRELLTSLVTHLHAFVKETGLTAQEWEQGIAFLTAAGHKCDDVRQEFILLSDTLGASMQTINVNNQAYQGATEATVFGPFFVEDAPAIELGGDMAFGAPGEACWVEGTVTEPAGTPPAGGEPAGTASTPAPGARLWLRRYNGPASRDDNAWAMAMSPGGGRVYVTGHDPADGSGATVAYNTSTGAQLWVTRYKGYSATAVAVSPDGATVFVAGYSHGPGQPGYVTVAYRG